MRIIHFIKGFVFWVSVILLISVHVLWFFHRLFPEYNIPVLGDIVNVNIVLTLTVALSLLLLITGHRKTMVQKITVRETDHAAAGIKADFLFCFRVLKKTLVGVVILHALIFGWYFASIHAFIPSVAIYVMTGLICYRLKYFRLFMVLLALSSLYLFKLTDWHYTVIGDEYSFYRGASEIVHSWPLAKIVMHLFDGVFVYGAHPFFSSLLQSWTIWIYGDSMFGWKASNVFLVIGSIMFFYSWVKQLSNNHIAIIAAVLMSFSHYLLSFSKIGYNNLQALFVLVVFLSLVTATVRRNSIFLAICSGITLALGFYVYPAGLYVISVFGVFIFVFMRKKRILVFLLISISFFILLLPLFVQRTYWQSKLAGTWVNRTDLKDENTALTNHMLDNVYYTLIAPFERVDQSHFVTGSYLELFSGMWVYLGLFVLLANVRKSRMTSAVILTFITLFFWVGVSHDRNYPPATRMFMLLPLWYVCAALGIYHVWLHIPQKLRTRWVAAEFALCVGIASLFHVFVMDIQSSAQYYDVEAQFARVLQKLPQAGKVSYTLLNNPQKMNAGTMAEMSALYVGQDIKDSMKEVIIETGDVGQEYVLHDQQLPSPDVKTLYVARGNITQENIYRVTALLGSPFILCVLPTKKEPRLLLWFNPSVYRYKLCGTATVQNTIFQD